MDALDAVNETTRHAHLILPTPSPAEQGSYELGLYLLAVRNITKWSWPALPPAAGTPETWEVIVPVEVNEDLMPGVVSLPHGWGHDVAESRLSVAQAHAGVNTNILTDNQAYDTASGTAVLFGTPVTIQTLSTQDQ